MADYTIEKLKDVAGNNFSFRDTSKYTKPSGGIPKSDLASAVQTSLSKADSALQSHQSLDGYVNNIQADSTATFGNESTIVVGKSGKNLLTRTALSLYNYIKGKLDSVYAAMNHVHSVKINGTTKTIAASGGTAVDLGSYDTSGTASSAVSAHNSSSSAHSSLFGAKADNTPTFSQASTRANLSGSGETMPTILGKIKKFFADLKALAFKDKVADGDISGTISDSHIASASTWNGKANANGSNASGTWDIDINGNAKTATEADEAIFQGAIRIGTTAVDLNTLVNDAPGEKLYWCSSSSIENVTNKPSSLTTGFLLRVQSPLSDGVDTMQFLYPRGTAAYYYVRRCTVAEGSSWSSWTQQWYGPTSTYDTSTTRAINSSAVASAIETKENTFNKVSSWSSDTTDTHYPSEKLVKDSLDAKADLTDLSRHVIATADSAARWVNIIDVNAADFDYWSYPIYIVAYSRGGAVHNAFIEFNHSSTMSIRNATDLVIGSEQGFTVASTYPLCYVLDTQNNKLHIWMYMHVRGPGEFVVRTTQRTFLSKFSYPSETTAVSSDGRPDGAVEFTRRNGITNDERDTWNAKQDALPTSGTASGTYSINVSGNAATASSARSISIEEIGTTTINLNYCTANDGRVHFYYWSYSNRGNVSNKPSDDVYTVEAFVQGTESLGTYVIQKAYKRGTDEIYIRRRTYGGEWSAWKPIVYGDGSNASGTWPISVTGNADTATEANFASKIGSSSSPQGIGSTSRPVFVDTDGSVKPCDSVNAELVGGYKIVIGPPTTTPESNAIYFY